MADSREYVARPLLVVVVLLAASAAVWVVLSAGEAGKAPPGGPGAEEELAGQYGPPQASSRPTTGAASAPASGPASSLPAVEWSPPKFTARQEERDRMAATIRSWGLDDKEVLKVMAAVPRHEFVPASMSYHAYSDTPLPIGYGQTISQPYIVAEMTRQLGLKGDSRVLEIGTGSGYQAAVLAHFTPHVYTMEIIKPLADVACARLGRLGYTVVKVRHGDGFYGWPGDVEFDAIIVTAAAGQVPPPLIKQLAPGGKMVIPVGRPYATQSLLFIEKLKDGTLRTRRLMAVSFVPFIREAKSGG